MQIFGGTSSSKPHTIQKQTDQLAAASWVLPEEEKKKKKKEEEKEGGEQVFATRSQRTVHEKHTSVCWTHYCPRL